MLVWIQLAEESVREGIPSAMAATNSNGSLARSSSKETSRLTIVRAEVAKLADGLSPSLEAQARTT